MQKRFALYSIKSFKYLLIKLLSLGINLHKCDEELRELTFVAVPAAYRGSRPAVVAVSPTYLSASGNPWQCLLWLPCRLNSAPVKGFEKDVGGKTTLRITYPEGAIQKMEQYEKDSLFVLAGFKWQDFKWLKYIVYKEKVVRTLSADVVKVP